MFDGKFLRCHVCLNTASESMFAMGLQLHKLSPRTFAALSSTGRHSDGGGLYLSISANGGRRWVFLYDWMGKRTELGLGSAREVGLAAARQSAAACRSKLSAGLNPKLTIIDTSNFPVPIVQTFSNLVDDYIATMRPSWKNDKHAAQWQMTLTKYTSVLHTLPLEDITTDHILTVLKPRWAITSETARRLRGRLEQVLDAAKAKGLRTGDNPARWRGHLEFMLPLHHAHTKGHHAALPYADVPGFLKSLREILGVAALAHVVGDKVEAACRRVDQLDKRRKLMLVWAEYCD